jgi:hypothetical protein
MNEVRMKILMNDDFIVVSHDGGSLIDGWHLPWPVT